MKGFHIWCFWKIFIAQFY